MLYGIPTTTTNANDLDNGSLIVSIYKFKHGITSSSKKLISKNNS
jgi:hypothetical protein